MWQRCRPDMAKTVRRTATAHTIERLPGDEQVDAKAIVLAPGHSADYDPFLMLSEDWFGPHNGFEWHPHRGIETVTLALEGTVAHADNTGAAGQLGPGDVQWMTAGRGIIHSELATTPVHTLQLWVNLPAARKMVDPNYQDIAGASAAIRREPGAEMRVYSGRSGDAVGPARSQHPIFFGTVRLDPDTTLVHELPGQDRFVAYIVEGSLADAPAGTVLVGNPAGMGPTELTLAAGAEGAFVVLFHGEPLRERVAQWGPFVMNTEAEIDEAIADYRAGRFGPVPA